MQEPLGIDPEIWQQRHKITKREYGKHNSFKEGCKAGRKSKPASANPYKLSSKIWKLLRQRAYWEIGRLEHANRPSKKLQKKQEKAKKEQLRRIEKALIKKKKKHHGHHRHHD